MKLELVSHHGSETEALALDTAHWFELPRLFWAAHCFFCN